MASSKLSIGILGLPNVGKSTLFRAVTKRPVDISNYPFTTIEPNVGVTEVDDERLYKLAEVQKPEKVVPAIIKFIDIAGLVKGAHKGEGLGNQFLAHLREADVLLHIVRCFKAENVSHINGRVDPKDDIEIIEDELILKDLETVEKRLKKIAKDALQNKKQAVIEFGVLNSLKEKLGKGETDFDKENEFVKELFLLIAKPQICLLNAEEKDIEKNLTDYLREKNRDWLWLDLRLELDKSELGEKDRKELELGEPELGKLIKKCYEKLGLITFFTIKGNEEARAWPIKKGKNILEGAAMIHQDFKEKFICAETANWQEVASAHGWKGAREKGLLKTVGKDYIIKDGDVIEIKI